MKKIFISGLVNVETTVKVREFPIPYYPIDYPFFKVNSSVGGVAYNIAKALKTLNDYVDLASMIGPDFLGEFIKKETTNLNISSELIKTELKQTPNSVVLYDDSKRRQIYCDLKDIQDVTYNFNSINIKDYDLVVACNINFNRQLLNKAKINNVKIATDVHVLSSIDDEYNKQFLEYADIVFLSDESLNENYKDFILDLENKYHNEIIVLGRGNKGTLMYLRDENKFYELEAKDIVKVVNTVGAGDALFSGFIHYYVKGNSPLDALKKAMIFASIKIGFDGASNGFVNEDELEKYNI